MLQALIGAEDGKVIVQALVFAGLVFTAWQNSHIKKTNDEIKKTSSENNAQLKPNGGSSLADGVNRIDRRTRRHDKVLSIHGQVMNTHSERMARMEGRLGLEPYHAPVIPNLNEINEEDEDMELDPKGE
jgi:hypothetical protein